MDADEWSKEKFMRRYRSAHLRNKTAVPMSIRNEDRHGLSNLVHERVKAFDKLHMPPWLVFLLIAFPLVFMYTNKLQLEEEELSDLRERNVLLAMRKTKRRREGLEERHEGTTELTKATVQYKELEKTKKAEADKLQRLKDVYLAGGARDKASEKVAIGSVING